MASEGLNWVLGSFVLGSYLPTTPNARKIIQENDGDDVQYE
ncbi:hypothetical protein [Rodentibacter pneumotropicus]|nr:hypothetical protein [Rodentibacter pneumotropicus]